MKQALPPADMRPASGRRDWAIMRRADKWRCVATGADACNLSRAG